jgi:hypothetical protein
MVAFTATALGVLVLLAGFVLLLVGIWLRVAGDRVDDMWPSGPWPEDAPTLDVQNHLGDSRPIR